MSLSPQFLKDLKTGHLRLLRQAIAVDSSLSPEIRSDTLSVYYRGGRLLQLRQHGSAYRVGFDAQYAKRPDVAKFPTEPWIEDVQSLPGSLDSIEDVIECLHLMPPLKATMDGWFAHHPKPEAECRQLLVQDNNVGPGNNTDYFVCDTERDERFEFVDKPLQLRFDFVAVHWPSTGSERKQTDGRGLVLGEVKDGDGAITGPAGIADHIDGLRAFLADTDRLAKLKEAMKTAFNQKRQLGFIDNQNDISSFEDNSQPIWLLVLVDHDPEKSRLTDILEELAKVKDPPAMIRIATSNFVGYGLYDQAIYTVEDFRHKFQAQIYANGAK